MQQLMGVSLAPTGCLEGKGWAKGFAAILAHSTSELRAGSKSWMLQWSRQAEGGFRIADVLKK